MAEADPRESGEPRPLPVEVAGPLAEMAQGFLILEHAISFYPEGHQARKAPLARCHQALLKLLAEHGTFTLGFVEGEILWDGKLHGALPPILKKFGAALEAQGITRVSWSDGVGEEELQAFVGRLAARRTAGERQPWDTEAPFEHIRVEGVDYAALMTDEGAQDGESERRRSLWQSLLLKCLADEPATLTEEELEVLRQQQGNPAELAALMLEALGPGALEEGGGVQQLRRLAAALGNASGGDGAARNGGAELFREAARHLPGGMRFRLIEAAVDEAQDTFFSQAFGTAPPEELVRLLASNFAMDPRQIQRLTRVFQHLVPRQLDRMELTPLMRGQLHQGGTPEEQLPENAWDEVQELLTGEAGDFMSEAYRELLQRLAAREEERRVAEATLAELPGFAQVLEAGSIGEEALRIRLEELHAASSREHFDEALAALVGRCRVAWAEGERGLGLLILGRFAALAAGTDPCAGPREAVEAALVELVTAEAAAEMVRALPGLDEQDRPPLREALLRVPETTTGALVDVLAAERDPGRRGELMALLVGIGKAGVPEILRRLEGASPEAARAYVAILAELRDDSAVPALVAALGRDHPRLRREALRALIAIDSGEVRRVLLPLLEDEDEEIVQIAAAHLGGVGSRDAADRLLRVLSSGSLSGRRAVEMKRAILALGRMRSPEAVAPLAGLLRRRSWIHRRAQEELGEAAAQALWRIGGQEARQALEEAASGASPAVAASCRRWLTRWSAP